jgi:hypothetical protein
MAAAWRTGPGAHSDVGMVRVARARSAAGAFSAYSFGPWFWSPKTWFNWSVL